MKMLKKLLSLFLIMQFFVGDFSSLSPASAEGVYGVEVSVDERSQPKVSVIVPVYNTEPYLRECLDSIKNQTLKEIEIICVDDGSTDNCGKILDEYAATDSRFIVIHQENKGGAAARNAGMKVAVGEYIAFVDSDDTIDENAYSVSYDKIKEVNADILATSCYTSSFGLRLNKIYDTGFELLQEHRLNRMYAVTPWDKLYKREFLIKNGFEFPEKVRVCHDIGFNLVVFPKAKRVICIENSFYKYRRGRPGSLQTASNAKKRAEYILPLIEFVCEAWRKNGYIEEFGSSWILSRISRVFYYNIFRKEECKMDFNRCYYINMFFKIMSPDIYNSETVKKCDEQAKQIICRLEYAAQHPEKFQNGASASKKIMHRKTATKRLHRKVAA